MRSIFSAICFLFAGAVYGSQYPLITSLDVSYVSGGAEYYITQKLVDIGTAADFKPPSGWLAGLGHKHLDQSGNGWLGSLESGFTTTNGNETASEAVSRPYSTQKSITHIHHNGSNKNPECVAYILGPRSSAPNYTAATDWDQSITPGGCLMVPPSDEWCKITSPEVVLEHGTITLQQAEGDTAESKVNVQCTAATAVTFNLITTDKYVYLDEGKSEITVDNKPLNSQIDLPQGDSNLTVKDLLTGVTTEGFHTGSSVLVMMPY